MKLKSLTSILVAITITGFSLQSCDKGCGSQSQSKLSVTSPTDDTTRAYQFFTKANNFQVKAQYDSSNFYFKQASLLYERNNRFERVIACLNQTGSNLGTQGKHQDAAARLKQALEMGLNKLGDQHMEVAKSYRLLGMHFNRQANYDSALWYHEKSLSLLRPVYGGNHIEIALNYSGLGNVFSNQGDHAKALKYYDDGLAILLATVGENNIETAKIYLNISGPYLYSGDYDRAIDYMRKSLSISTKILGNNHPLVAGTYNNIGLIYQFRKDYQKANEAFEQAVDIAKNLLGENHPDVARNYFNIGNNYRLQGKYKEALKSYEKSIGIQTKAYGAKHPELVSSYMGAGIVYDKTKRYDSALEYYEKALAMDLEIVGEKHPQVSLLYNNIGVVYSNKGDYGRALRYYQKSIISLVPGYSDSSVYSNPHLKHVLSEDYLINTLRNKALDFYRLYTSISHDMKDIEMSLTTYDLGVELIHKMRSALTTEGSKLVIGEDAGNIHGEAIGVALKIHEQTNDEKYKSIALAFAQRGKASALQDALQELHAKQFSGIPKELIEKEQELKTELTSLETEIQEEYQDNKGVLNERLKELEVQHFALSTKYRKLVSRFEKAYPKYYSLKYQKQLPSVTSLQQRLDAYTSLLEYFLSDSVLYVFVISQQQFDVSSVPIDSSFKEVVLSCRRTVKKIETEKFIQCSVQLYQLLLKPIEHFIVNKKKLIIVPHGVLHYIPFECLIEKEPRTKDSIQFSSLDYLINKFEISYQYSSVIRSELARSGHAISTISFAGFAPVFSDTNNSINTSIRAALDKTRTDWTERGLSRNGMRLEKLQRSFEEVETIVGIFKGQGKPAVGYFHEEASEDNFKLTAGKYRYVHIATHGFINEDELGLSGIFFSQPITVASQKEDGFLYSAETFTLNLKADLVVLASCESGIGKLVTGEGLMALTRGLLYSGAKKVIVSQWKVGDLYTSQLMINFYKGLASRTSISGALRDAKLNMIKNEATAFPKIWSSFILIE